MQDCAKTDPALATDSYSLSSLQCPISLGWIAQEVYARNTLWQEAGKGEEGGWRVDLCQNEAITYLTQSPVLTAVAVHKSFWFWSLQGRKHSVYLKGRISYYDQIDCIKNSSECKVNIKQDLMKPRGTAVSKVHIILWRGHDVLPTICIAFCGQKVMSDPWNFFGQRFMLEPKPSWQPPSSVCHPPLHALTQTHANLCTQLQMNAHTCHPAQRLGVLGKFLTLPLACWVGGSGLPENSGTN